LRVGIAFDIIDDTDCKSTAFGGIAFIEVEHVGDFEGGSRVSILAVGDIDRGGFDAIPVDAAEHLLFGDFFMTDEGIVDDFLCYAGDSADVGYILEFVPEGLFFMRHGHPFDAFIDFPHFVGASRGSHDFTGSRGFFQQRIGWISTTSHIVSGFVFTTKGGPFGGIVEDGGYDGSTGRIGTSGEAVIHDGNGAGTTLIADIGFFCYHGGMDGGFG